MAIKKNVGGRPTIYSQKLSDELCKRLARGSSLRAVCSADDMPDAATVFNWLGTNKRFLEQYEQAKVASADADLETIEQLGDIAIQEAKDADPKAANAVVSAYKLKADNIKWGMSKKKPKKYGDKLALGGDSDSPLTIKIVKYGDKDK